MEFRFPGWSFGSALGPADAAEGARAGPAAERERNAGAAGAAGADDEDLLGDLQDLSDDEGAAGPGSPGGVASGADAAGQQGSPGGRGPPRAGAAAAPAGAGVGAGAQQREGQPCPQQPPGRAGRGAALPVEVLLLVLGAPGMGPRELVSALQVCSEWRGAVAGSGGLWAPHLAAELPAAAAGQQQGQQQQQGGQNSQQQQQGGQNSQQQQGQQQDQQEQGQGQGQVQLRRAPPPPPWRLPPGLAPADPLLHLLAWRSLSAAAARFGCLRKGFEFLCDACAAVFAAVDAAAAAAAAGAAGGGGAPSRRITHVDQLWEGPADGERLAVDDRHNARAVQRVVGKLASHDWQAAYSGFVALVDCKARDCAAALRALSEARAAAAARGGGGGGAAGGAAGAGAAAGGGGAGGGGWHEGGGSLRGGVLREMERAMEGASARLATEPEVLLAVCGRGPRPDEGIRLARALLARWDAYRRALDVLVSRCGPLGASVERARQEMLAGPAPRGGGGGAAPLTIPHLLNRGLLSFRSSVVLAYGIRRPLQSALSWLAARDKEGFDLQPADAATLERAQRMLTELDAYDDASSPPLQHTHEKFRACFGFLLLRDRAAERLGLRERC
ncbi:hypothetical protein Rsub_00412 [Raphidocelis subcapitata]|uniref:F-box domain-containing protein n=1 Tax=Raphidocelis subcapitata TaxID=307507 RepID=A0A2V0NK88_9CHLO|nr:hypothetical protein Rsub_00412 [Raphidocelis subcapitata]|eukprot:GBF87701.1 hypothetical protein Rsub_00412 [Raphidocelis subcapitata]